MRSTLVVLFLGFNFLFLFSANGQTDEEIDFSGAPVYRNLSKALRNADHVYSLNLSDKGLTEFPAEILNLKELRYLVLDSNKISNIPAQINTLQKLKCLSLANNMIRELPQSIGDLGELQYLYLDHNIISNLTSGIFRLHNLKELFVNDNKLDSLSFEIRSLQKLDKLVASDNQLVSIPDEIGHSYNLKVLSLGNNHIRELPEHFYELRSLEKLYLGSNDLEKIDAHINKFYNLKILALQKNKLKSLPPEIGKLYSLKELFIGYNPMKEIPASLSQLINLQWLNVKELAFQPFPQVLYDLQNNGTNIEELSTKELYQAKILLSQARNKKLTGQLAESISKYEKLISLDTNNVVAMSELAAAYLSSEEYDKAAALCKRALLKNVSAETLKEIRTTYSNSLNRTNEYDKIISSYNDKIKADSGSAQPYFELGKFYYDQEKYEEAKGTFLKAIKIDPSHADSHFYLSILFLISEQKELYIFSFLRLFILEPKSNKVKTSFPFFLTKMNMKSGVEGKNGSTYYVDTYVIRNEDNEIIYKSKDPSTDLLAKMIVDITMKNLSSNDSSGVDSTALKIIQSAFNVNKTNVEIAQQELTKICETPDSTIIQEEKTFWGYYLPYFSDLIRKGHLETFSNMISSSRGHDKNASLWIKNNPVKVDAFNLWNKTYDWKRSK